jgi:hypothetical protein
MASSARLTAALVALALVLGVVAPSLPGSVAPAAASPLFETRSYYIANAGNDAMRMLGCHNGDTQGRSSLFFGAPVDTRGAFGATLWGGADLAVEEIGELLKEYVRGYVWCRRSGNFQLMVGMGTSNSAVQNKPDGWLHGHGQRWAAVVANINFWAEHFYPGIARVYGAWDVEPSWSSPGKADSWMLGYNSHPPRRSLHANWSADGCPRDSSANGACNNGWNQEWMWRLSWRYDPSLPYPQIYATSGVNARQWQQIDLYGAIHHGDGMVFWGALAQHAACVQMGGCHRTDNTPRRAHDHLLWHLNTHPATSQGVIENMSNMHWHR